MSILNRVCALALAALLAASAAHADGIINGGSGGGAPSGNAGGDLGGTYPNPSVAKIVGVAPGAGVATAFGVNIGSAGAVITFNGALGTPSSGLATNLTGLPISTGLTGAGTGVLTALGVNVGSAGAPVLFNGAGGTPSSMTATNLSGTAASLTAGNATQINSQSVVGSGAWTLTANTFNPTGTPTYTGSYSKAGPIVFITIVTGGTGNISTTAGTSTFTNLPFTAAHSAVCPGVANGGTGIQTASGGYITGTTWFVPAIGATAASAPLWFTCSFDTGG